MTGKISNALKIVPVLKSFLNFHGLDSIRPLLANSLDATDNAGAMREEGHLLWVLYSCGGVWGVVGGVVSVWGGKFIVSLL